MCSHSLTIFSTRGSYCWRIKVLLVEDQPHLEFRRRWKPMLSSSKIIWVPTAWAQKVSFLWSSRLFFFTFIILSAFPKVSSSSSSQLLFVPLNGAGCWWRWWCHVLHREGRSWKEVTVFKYFGSITLECDFVKCLFSLNSKYSLLLYFVARLSERRWFCFLS